jgi:hypothetical protein
MLITIKKPGVVNFNFSNVIYVLKEYKVSIMGVYYNYTVYSIYQLNRLVNFSRYRSLELFYNSLRRLLIKPCSKFIK